MPIVEVEIPYVLFFFSILIIRTTFIEIPTSIQRGETPRSPDHKCNCSSCWFGWRYPILSSDCICLQLQLPAGAAVPLPCKESSARSGDSDICRNSNQLLSIAGRIIDFFTYYIQYIHIYYNNINERNVKWTRVVIGVFLVM